MYVIYHTYMSREKHKNARNSVQKVACEPDFMREFEFCARNYLEMSRGLANSGVEKWTFDTNKMTMTYYYKGGNVMLLEEIN